MIVPHRMTGSFARLLLVGFLVFATLGGTGLFDRSFGDEAEKEQGYVRNVDSSPSLAETEKTPGWSYNSDYLFAISRAVRDSRIPPAGKVFLFIPAIPLDLVLSPFAAIAGLFGD